VLLVATKLTKALLDKKEYDPDGAQVQYLWDTQLQGFGARLYASGKKSFVIQYRVEGRLRFMVLGQFGPFTVDEARKKAKTKLAETLSGKDPAKDRRQARHTFSTAPTLQQVFDYYVERPAFLAKSVSHRTGFKKKLQSYILPKLGKMKIKEIQRRDLRMILEDIADSGKHPTAKVILSFSRILFNFALDQELVDHNPCERLKLDLQIHARDRVLDEDEIRTFWNSLPNIGVCPQVQLALKLQLVTAQRIGEIAKTRWEHIDLEKGIWTIPRENVKNRKADHLIPLSRLATELIEALSQYRDTTGWLLPSPSKHGVHVNATTMTRAIWKERKKGAFKDLPRFTPHDLRRTTATMLSREEVERSYIKQILNHTESDVTSIYIRDDYLKSKKRYLDLWATKLEQILRGGSSAGNNVAMINGRK